MSVVVEVRPCGLRSIRQEVFSDLRVKLEKILIGITLVDGQTVIVNCLK